MIVLVLFMVWGIWLISYCYGGLLVVWSEWFVGICVGVMFGWVLLCWVMLMVDEVMG